MTDFSNRHKENFKGIKLPSSFTPEYRGIDSCCEPFVVFASPDVQSWKNDFSSAWKRDCDSIIFRLVKKSTGLEIYQDSIDFPNDENAKYCTINWHQIYVDYGIGCYDLFIDYSISGLTGTELWASYNLKVYSVESKMGYVRIKSIFNSVQGIEGINTLGSNMIDCINIKGKFWKMKPNMQIDNLTYQNRSTEVVINQNLKTYSLETDGLYSCAIDKLVDLHLLSGRDIYVSDHNAHSARYSYLDFNVIVNESPEIEEIEFDRRSTLTCVFGKKQKNEFSKSST